MPPTQFATPLKFSFKAEGENFFYVVVQIWMLDVLFGPRSNAIFKNEKSCQLPEVLREYPIF